MKKGILLLSVFAAMFFIIMHANSFADDITLTTSSPAGGSSGGWTVAGSNNYATATLDATHGGSNGSVGIGTTAPVFSLNVSNSTPTGGKGAIDIDGYGTSSCGTLYLRQALGNQGAPIATQALNNLGFIGFRGYANSAFTADRAYMQAYAIENWSANQQGTAIAFSTTPGGTIIPKTAMVIADSGSVGVGTTSPASQAEIHVSPPSGQGFGRILVEGFAPPVTAGTSAANYGIITIRAAEGTRTSPQATQWNDYLGLINFRGYAADTGFGTMDDGTTSGSSSAAIGAYANEWVDQSGPNNHFTSTRQGTNLVFWDTPRGSATKTCAMMTSGNHVVLGGALAQASTFITDDYQVKDSDGVIFCSFFGVGGKTAYSVYMPDPSSLNIEGTSNYTATFTIKNFSGPNPPGGTTGSKVTVTLYPCPKAKIGSIGVWDWSGGGGSQVPTGGVGPAPFDNVNDAAHKAITLKYKQYVTVADCNGIWTVISDNLNDANPF